MGLDRTRRELLKSVIKERAHSCQKFVWLFGVRVVPDSFNLYSRATRHHPHSSILFLNIEICFARTLSSKFWGDITIPTATPSNSRRHKIMWTYPMNVRSWTKLSDSVFPPPNKTTVATYPQQNGQIQTPNRRKRSKFRVDQASLKKGDCVHATFPKRTAVT